jgi:ElaB/YqjD/DUF883 family membrane-anchored ribosome-binding protein
MDNDRNRENRPGSLGASTGATGGMGAGSTGMGAGTSGLGRSTGDDGGVRAGSYDRKFNDSGSTTEELREAVGDKLDEGRERVHEALDTGRERAGEAFDTGRNRVAGQLESIGDRLEERARTMEDAGGVQRRAGQATRRASEAFDNSAEYIRSHDANDIAYVPREPLRASRGTYLSGEPLTSIRRRRPTPAETRRPMWNDADVFGISISRTRPS